MWGVSELVFMYESDRVRVYECMCECSNMMGCYSLEVCDEDHALGELGCVVNHSSSAVGRLCRNAYIMRRLEVETG